MRILCVIPPYVPSYFNAGHHLPLFQVASYLRKTQPENDVLAVDGAALNMNWREMSSLLATQFDVVALLNDFDAVDTFPRMLEYIREYTPSAKTITFGRLSNQVPQFFTRFGLDGIASAGDYEASVAGFVRWLHSNDVSPPGVALLRDGNYTSPAPGVYLDAEEWVFPDVRDIPYAAYDRMYQHDLNKFCGIPQRRELVVPLARGCPVGCEYCDVPIMQGKRERRVDVATALSYITESFASEPFEYVSFYAPTFTLKRAWVASFCDEVKARGLKFSWKCVTTTFHLDADILASMAEAGCVRVSVGLETLDIGAADSLPKIKRDSLETFRKLAGAARQNGIELNCFVIVGLPGDSVAGVERTVLEVLEQGCRVRPTVYTPYGEITADMTVDEVSRFNRQTLIGSGYSPSEKASLYKLIFANEADRATDVMERIERREAVRVE